MQADREDRDLRAVHGRDALNQVVRLVNNHNTAFEPDPDTLSRVLSKHHVAQSHAYATGQQDQRQDNEISDRKKNSI